MHGDAVFVQREELAGGVRVEGGEHDGQRRAVTGEGLVRDERVRDVLRAELHVRLADGERIRLREKVAHELVVVGNYLALEVDGLLRLDDADEVAGDGAALVDELVEGVLAVGAGLAEVDLARLEVQGVPSMDTPLPLDSMATCWMWGASLASAWV